MSGKQNKDPAVHPPPQRQPNGHAWPAGFALTLILATGCTTPQVSATGSSVPPAAPPSTPSALSADQVPVPLTPVPAASRSLSVPTPLRSPTARTLTTAAVDYQDPLAIARGYVLTCQRYHFDNPTGWVAALTAPAYTTDRFAAASRPSAQALRRLQIAHDISTATVNSATLHEETPHEAGVVHVLVDFTATLRYRGAGSGRTTRQMWLVRETRTSAGQWRVDGVPAST